MEGASRFLVWTGHCGHHTSVPHMECHLQKNVHLVLKVVFVVVRMVLEDKGTENSNIWYYSFCQVQLVKELLFNGHWWELIQNPTLPKSSRAGVTLISVTEQKGDFGLVKKLPGLAVEGTCRRLGEKRCTQETQKNSKIRNSLLITALQPFPSPSRRFWSICS